MTSWIRAPLRKKEEKERPLSFQLDDLPPVSQFLWYGYAVQYARNAKKQLMAYDMNSVISATYPLLRSTFQAVPDVTFTDTIPMVSTGVSRRNANRMAPFLAEQKVDELQATAIDCLAWTPEITKQIQTVIDNNKLPTEFDIGIYLRSLDSGGLRASRQLSVASYIDAVKDLAKETLKRDTLTLFVVSDSDTLTLEFKRRVPSTWKVYEVVKTTPAVSMLDPTTLGRANQRTRMTAYVEHLAELSILQSVEHVIASLGSDLGRFVHLTSAKWDTFRSLDTNGFTPY